MDARRARILVVTIFSVGLITQLSVASAAAATCTLTAPTTVAVGAHLPIVGSGFPASSNVDISVKPESGSSGEFAVQSDANGAFQISLTPEGADGAKTTVVATAGAGCTAQLVFAVGTSNVAITPDPTESGAGARTGAPRTDAAGDPDTQTSGASRTAWIRGCHARHWPWRPHRDPAGPEPIARDVTRSADDPGSPPGESVGRGSSCAPRRRCRQALRIGTADSTRPGGNGSPTRSDDPAEDRAPGRRNPHHPVGSTRAFDHHERSTGPWSRGAPIASSPLARYVGHPHGPGRRTGCHPRLDRRSRVDGLRPPGDRHAAARPRGRGSGCHH